MCGFQVFMNMHIMMLEICHGHCLTMSSTETVFLTGQCSFPTVYIIFCESFDDKPFISDSSYSSYASGISHVYRVKKFT